MRLIETENDFSYGAEFLRIAGHRIAITPAGFMLCYVAVTFVCIACVFLINTNDTVGLGIFNKTYVEFVTEFLPGMKTVVSKSAFPLEAQAAYMMGIVWNLVSIFLLFLVPSSWFVCNAVLHNPHNTYKSTVYLGVVLLVAPTVIAFIGIPSPPEPKASTTDIRFFDLVGTSRVAFTIFFGLIFSWTILFRLWLSIAVNYRFLDRFRYEVMKSASEST